MNGNSDFDCKCKCNNYLISFKAGTMHHHAFAVQPSLSLSLKLSVMITLN